MYLSMRLAMAANHGLITTYQARDCGLTTSQLGHLVRSGALVSCDAACTPTASSGRPSTRTVVNVASAPGPPP